MVEDHASLSYQMRVKYQEHISHCGKNEAIDHVLGIINMQATREVDEKVLGRMLSVFQHPRGAFLTPCWSTWANQGCGFKVIHTKIVLL